MEGQKIHSPLWWHISTTDSPSRIRNVHSRRPINSATERFYRLKITADQEEQSVGCMLCEDKWGADYLQLVCPGKLMPNQFFKLHLGQTCCKGFTIGKHSWTRSTVDEFWHWIHSNNLKGWQLCLHILRIVHLWDLSCINPRSDILP